MKQLHVLRHLKSDRDNPALEDHERPLARRGLRDGSVLGPWLRRQEIAPPDVVLCSSAQRTRETLAFVMPYWDPAPQVQILSTLYLASADEILSQVRQYGGSAARLMVIGHNDGLQVFAGRLAGAGEAELLASLADGFPTGAFARYDVPIGRWQELGWRTGCLTGFDTPKQRQMAMEQPA